MNANAGSAGTGNAATDPSGGRGSSQGRAIFISYRRDDSEGEAGRLYDDLARAYGDSSVFMDVAGIEPGLDFRKAIDDNVAACGVLLAVIGPTWATIVGHDGTRRLDNASDYVRLEIASALKRGIPVIPVLVHEAHMPALEQLPDDLKDLRYRNSVEITHARWRTDVDLFITALKPYVETKPAHPEATIHATVPVQLPAPQPAPAAVRQPRTPFGVGLALGGLAVVAVLALLFFFVLRPRWQANHQAAAESNPSTPLTGAPSTTAVATPVSTSTTTPATTPASVTTPTTSATTASASSTPIPVAMVGIWKTTAQVGPKSDTIEQLSILEFAGKFSARAYGACADKPCDWGIRNLTMDNGFAVSEKPWEPRNTDKDSSMQRKVSVSMALNGDTLLVTVKNQIIDPTRGHLFNMRDMQFKKTQ